MAEGLLELALALASAPSPDAVESASPEDPVPDRLNIFQDLMMSERYCNRYHRKERQILSLSLS